MTRLALALLATLSVGVGLAAGQPASAPAHSRGWETWADVEFLYWWEKDQPLPPNLITTGSVLDPQPGVLGQPSTQVLFGPSGVNYDGFSGLRVCAGAWLDPEHAIGFEASGFGLEAHRLSTSLASLSGTDQLLALTRVDSPTGAPGAFVIAAPSVTGQTVGPYTGTLLVSTHTRLFGADADVLHSLWCSECFNLRALAGFRYLNLEDSLDIDTQTTAASAGGTFTNVSFLGGRFGGVSSTRSPSGNPVTTTNTTTTNDTTTVNGTTTTTNQTTNTTATTSSSTTTTTNRLASVLTSDRFQTRNQFYGGQIGLRGEYLFDWWFVGAVGTLALGETETVLDVTGSSTLNNPVSLAKQVTPGGLYALRTNSGHFVDQSFAVVPEVQVKGGLLVNSWFRATVGYDFLYWSRVVRPGSQVDLNIDPRLVPTSPSFNGGLGAVAPRPMMNHSSFWAQGLTVGLEFNY